MSEMVFFSSFRFGATGCAWLSCMQAVMDTHIVGLTEWSTNGNSTISQMEQVFALLNFQFVL